MEEDRKKKYDLVFQKYFDEVFSSFTFAYLKELYPDLETIHIISLEIGHSDTYLEILEERWETDEEYKERKKREASSKENLLLKRYKKYMLLKKSIDSLSEEELKQVKEKYESSIGLQK
jgi:hypothetical protein